MDTWMLVASGSWLVSSPCGWDGLLWSLFRVAQCAQKTTADRMNDNASRATVASPPTPLPPCLPLLSLPLPCLRSACFTKTIDFSGKSLSATLDYPVICRLTAKNARLARLRLSCAGLCGVGWGGRGRRSTVGPISIALTLEANPPRLVVLDVSRSFVDDAAVEAMAAGLEKNHVLTTLALQGNNIGEQVRDPTGP